MIIKDLISYLEKLNETETLSVYLENKKIEVNTLNMDCFKEINLIKDLSTKHRQIKDLLIQLEVMDSNNAIGFRIISEKGYMKDYIMVLKDEKIILEKVKVNFEIINYYFYELQEDNDLDYEEELFFNLGKALESYFNLEEVSFHDGYIFVKDVCVGINSNCIEIEDYKKYSLYTENVNEKNLIKLKEDFIKYIETDDFSVFKYEGDFDIS